MIEKIIKIVILSALGIFLYMRLIDGSILFYINERFLTLTLFAAIGLMLIAFSYLRQPQFHNDAAQNHEEDENEHPHHNHHQHSDHSHGELTWLGLLLVALPVILGFIVQPRPLGASALNNREIDVGAFSSVSLPSVNESMGLVAGEKNIMDWLVDFQRISEPSGLDGTEATVIGFVYRDERFADNRFMVGRFILSCCVADANPVGLIVQWPEASTLVDDQWVSVKGHFEAGEFNGVLMPILIGDEITLTQTPEQPYLYR